METCAHVHQRTLTRMLLGKVFVITSEQEIIQMCVNSGMDKSYHYG